MSIPFVAHGLKPRAYYWDVEEWKRRFNEAREAKGYSYADLARFLQERGRDVTPGAIAHWFRDTEDPENKRNLNVTDLILLCDATGIDIVFVISGHNLDELVRKKLRELIDPHHPPPPKVPAQVDPITPRAKKISGVELKE